jgi:hypothetical protein
MNIIITSGYVDPDDQMIEFRVAIEGQDFKGATTLYGDRDCFTDFAQRILKFPFESEAPITFEGFLYAGEPCLRIELILKEAVGLIDIIVTIKDTEAGNSAQFSDSSVSTQALHRFARILLRTDFTQLQTIEFDSEIDDEV